MDGFQGKSLARLPLYWAVPAGADAAPWVSLNRGEQAYWTEVPYQGEEDCSAQAAVTWDDRGMHLWCRVLDDVHVTDANEDDLYENDSVQVYFDFGTITGRPQLRSWRGGLHPCSRRFQEPTAHSR